MIRTDVVLTLRDLRDEHPLEVRRISRTSRFADFDYLYVQAVIELAGVALEWRKDDRYPTPEGVFEGMEAERDPAVSNFVVDLGGVLAKRERICLYGADCSLITSWEPVEESAS